MCTEMIYYYRRCGCSWRTPQYEKCVFSSYYQHASSNPCPHMRLDMRKIVSGNGKCRNHGGETEDQAMKSLRIRRAMEEGDIVEMERRKREGKEKEKGLIGRFLGT